MKKFIPCIVVISLLVSLVFAGISCTKAKPTISYSPPSLSFTATQGGDNPAIQAIGIWNSGGGALSWSVSDDATWLNLSPTNGSSTGGTSNVIVSVNISALTAGSHIAMVTISAPAAANNPQTIPVTLTVVSPPTPTPAPTPISTQTPTGPTPTPILTPPPIPTPASLDLSGNINGSGVVQQTIHYVILNGQGVLDIGSGTIALLGGNPLQSITVDEVCGGFPPPPAGAHIIGCAYDYKPNGATFSPPINLTLQYDPGLLPAGVDASKLAIAYYDTPTSKWVVLLSTVNTVNHTATAQVSHYTLFAVYAAAPAATPTP